MDISTKQKTSKLTDIFNTEEIKILTAGLSSLYLTVNKILDKASDPEDCLRLMHILEAIELLDRKIEK